MPYHVKLNKGQKFIAPQRLQKEFGNRPIDPSTLSQEQLKTLYDAGVYFVEQDESTTGKKSAPNPKAEK